ncbi:MAG: 23S rRNA (guanosine(2251)-2'-O)-methyltransferase RlmB [Oscillospiraceae bacterium]|nr:23S rRNA (guanosine(2251)-2'-O)-methyltransferase RlmB [Oscillospiraceae bacterium]
MFIFEGDMRDQDKRKYTGKTDRQRASSKAPSTEKRGSSPVREDRNSDLVYGKNPVSELLKSGMSVDTVYISDTLNPSMQNYYTALGKEAGAVVKRVNPNKLNAMCGTENHQGVAANASGVEYADIARILESARSKGEAPFIVICDGIEDPHNLGAIIRSAFLFGAHGVVIPKRGGVRVTSTVHKSSAGAAVHLPIARVANISRTVRELKKENIFVYAADMKDTPLYKDDLTGPIAIVIGNEGKGVSPLVKSLCDGIVSIPMKDTRSGVDSFNASVAAGIIMYEISRQRIYKD